MATTVKMCDMSTAIVAVVFEMLNEGNVHLEKAPYFGTIIVTDVEPKDLVYPEGWYYARGSLRNKNTWTPSIYNEIPMETSDGVSWEELALYGTFTEVS